MGKLRNRNNRGRVIQMGYVEMRRVDNSELDTCDQCNQQGLKISGLEVNDEHGVVVMWLCFNCKQRYNS